MKHWLKAIAASVLALALLVVPATASDLPDQYSLAEVVKIAHWAGVTDDFQIVVEKPDDITYVNGYFWEGGVACDWMFCSYEPPTVNIQVGSHVPKYVELYVLLHELGHYRQWKAGEFTKGYDIKEIELGADTWAAEQMCQMGLDGIKLTRENWEWERIHNGYEGDPNHGTLQERIDSALTAPSCRPPQPAQS